MHSLNIRFTGENQIEIVEEPVPTLAANQLLVRTHHSLISTGTESIALGRKFAPGTPWDHWVQYPFYPGYLNAGEVLRVGTAITAFKPGDRVTTRAPHGQVVLSTMEYTVPIPDGVSDEDASWFGLAKITQVGVRCAAAELGADVVIIGLGLLGQLVTQYARLAGARTIVAIDTAPRRLEMARAHGATHALQVNVADARDRVAEITRGRLADIVYDVTGHAAVFAHALPLVRKFGKLILLGDTGTPSEQRLSPDVINRGITIIGAHDNHSTPLENDHQHWTQVNMGRLFLTYLQRGQMRVNDLVTHRFSPRDARQAYALLQTHRADAMGVVFDWNLI